MKYIALAGAAILALGGAATAQAGDGMSDGISGFVEANVGAHNRYAFDDETENGWFPTGEMSFAVNMPLGDGWNFQIDGFGGGSAPDASDFAYAYGGGGTQVFWRNSDYAVGMFAAAGVLYIPADGTVVTVGLEGAMFEENSTHVLQWGYLSRIDAPFPDMSHSDFISNGMIMSYVFRYFFDDDMMASIGVAGVYGQMDSTQDDIGAGRLNLRFENKPEGWPVSYFVDLTATVGVEVGDDTDMHPRMVAGLRLPFGQETLKGNDRHGATFGLPPFKDFQQLAGGALE